MEANKKLSPIVTELFSYKKNVYVITSVKTNHGL